MDFNDTRLTKQNLPPFALFCFDHTAGRLFPGRVSSVSEVSIPSTTLPLGWSPVPVKSPSGQVSQWSTFPLDWSPVPIKFPSGGVSQWFNFPFGWSPVPVKSPSGPLMSQAI